MNILDLILNQIDQIRQLGDTDYLNSIKVHIERAYKYYQKGSTDSCYYNDVVYRTNQAYEGALKEAYKILDNKTTEQVARKTPQEIEKYLQSDSIFKDRVMQLFENYRHEWRNKSTHDYNLVIDSSEAFLALINVSCFVHLLLKVIQEKLVYNFESMRTIPVPLPLKEGKSLIDRTLELLSIFKKENSNLSSVMEFELMGKLTAFLENTLEAKIIRESLYSYGSHKIRIDLLISCENEEIFIEVKKLSTLSNVTADVNQLSVISNITGLQSGILFYGVSGDELNEIPMKKISSQDKKEVFYIV